ncbi:MAG: metallophosphoesterase [Anaerolineae bacterium]|jgi:predicted phosphodiesterase|nr:metallophosphoesterase [Anaerolineae bacterium]
MKRYWLTLILISLLMLVACTKAIVQPAVTITPTPSTERVAPQLTSTPTLTPTATLHPTVTASATPTPYPVDFPLGDVQYRIPPIIRFLDQDEVTIFFELDQPVEGKVLVIDESGDWVQEQAWEAEETRHMITFEGLNPGISYQLIPVITATAGWTAPMFQGQAWSLDCTLQNGEFPLRIGVISDASFGDEVTRQFVAEMASADLDFVLHLGDVVDETEWDVDPYASYAENFFTPFAPLLKQMPVYTVIGNHDYDADIRYNEEPFYFTVFPAAPQMADRQYYSFTYNDIRFLFLDAMTLWGMPGRKAQEEWLAEQLADTETTTIILSHIAPFSSSSVHPDDSAPFQNLWVPQFEGANVPLVLSGHFHHYERLNVNGITYIVAGGGSQVTYALGQYLPESEVVQRVSHYVILELRAEEIHLSAIDVDGTIIDEVVIAD